MDKVGFAVVGSSVGYHIGSLVGDGVGFTVGSVVGILVGSVLRSIVGMLVGADKVGISEGKVGFAVGSELG